MNTVDADSICKIDPDEQELIKETVNVDVAVCMPIVPEGADVQIAFDYNAIVKPVNDYIERCTIDPRISEIEYNLSTPSLPDADATTKLQEVLVAEIDKVETPEGVTPVDNGAIADDKVCPVFELSVEETVCYNDALENTQQESESVQPPIPAKPKQTAQTSSAKVEQCIKPTKTPTQTIIDDGKTSRDLIIYSAEPKLYFVNAPTASLYGVDLPSITSSPIKAGSSPNKTLLSEKTKDKLIDGGLETSEIFGSGLDSAAGITDTAVFRKVNVGDNGRVYFKEHARGNSHYKIAGKLADSKAVKVLGIAGKVFDYGSKAYQAKLDWQEAETTQDKGRIAGGTLGGVVAGGVAGTVTTNLVAIVGMAIVGTAAAPLTIICVAGVAMIAGAAASEWADDYGEQWGGDFGAKAVEYFETRAKKK